ncbi:hypothetical protein [Mangrovihabitans endophyticus]|uniref:Uncharacterized protein n=1 Tax=Mangrovihabitans endophyticus TaxID=1751298 RepID=A0A8J3C2E8_9ACTN|nr:hypothetical protein [Mangrovihabitans endophyticus]GGL05239.1 hypothetical protein GCM10012284_44670 [Mangrovihabitans endophyticus]
MTGDWPAWVGSYDEDAHRRHEEELARERAELAHKNRPILAERLGYPPESVAACEALEDEFPGWTVAYLHENKVPGFAYPAGYHAWRRGRPFGGPARLHGATPEELRGILLVRNGDDG